MYDFKKSNQEIYRTTNIMKMSNDLVCETDRQKYLRFIAQNNGSS